MARLNDAIERRMQAPVGLDALWQDGAAVERMTRRGLLVHYLRRALGSIRAAPFTSFMTLATMIFSLFVFSVFLLLYENVNRALAGTQGEIAMSVFIKEGIDNSARDEIRLYLENNPSIRTVTFVDKAQALKNFTDAVGAESPLLEGLEGSNPLPASYHVTFRSVDDLESHLEEAAKALKEFSGVEHVEYSRGLVSAVVRAIKSVQIWGALGIIIVLLMSAFIITVAIRLALYSHRHEIEIMYLVGADKTFIRTPYVVEGLLQGMCGAFISVVMLALLLGPIRRGVADVSIVELTIGQVAFLSFPAVALVVMLGFAVGVLASFLAVRSHLTQPRMLSGEG
jgi:cell division transport system permease protein